MSLAALIAAGMMTFQTEAAPDATTTSEGLTLAEYLKQVVSRNESIQTRILEVEFNRRRTAAEYGAFEPEAFAEFSHQENNRENTVEQRLNQSGRAVFHERNNIYQGGIETLAPSGGRVRLGYTLRDLNNNLPSSIFSSAAHTNAEYQTFFGITFAQPLLKNAWYPANLAAIRVAAISSELAYQEYRRQMMVILSTAVANYWNLYLAQEQLRFFRESVGTAEKILNDDRVRLQAGRGAELDVLEAEAGLALRRSKLAEAEQKLYEAANRLLSLASSSVLDSKELVRVAEEPMVSGEEFTFFNAWRNALDVNPDYLSQRLKTAQEMVRLAYARNQRLPEVNLKASYGLNGLGRTPGESWEDIEQRGFPSWSVGAELRIPLAGNIRARNELIAARLRHRQALVGLRDVESQVANAIDTALHKIRSAKNTVESYRSVVDFNRNLLDSALARLDVGRIENRKILDIEEDLLEARNAAAEAKVQYQRAVLELQLIEGSVLKNYGFDFTQSELRSLTDNLARHGDLSDEAYAAFVQNVRESYEDRKWADGMTETSEQREARRALEQQMSAWGKTNSPLQSADDLFQP